MSVKIASDGPVTIVTINRPEKRNAVDPDTAIALRDGRGDDAEAQFQPIIYPGLAHKYTPEMFMAMMGWLKEWL